MRWQYLEWNEGLEQALRSFANLMSLFNFLLLKAGGDADQSLRWMEYLQERGLIDEDVDLDQFRSDLRQSGIIDELDGVNRLTAKGERQVREDSLKTVFSNLKKGGLGDHQVSQTGEGSERLSETRAYRFGDPLTNIDHVGSINNAIKRHGIESIEPTEEDLRVYETEHRSSCATVLLIDISHSMILYGEDRITPAKQVALALTELILTQYPKDSLAVAVFGDQASEIPIRDIPYLTIGPYHTNTKAGLQLAQSILRRQNYVNKQIFMITDGKPSAINEGGQLYKNSYGLDRKIINATLEEATLCRKSNITITTYMVTDDPYLVEFVEDLSAANKGKAYYTSLENLGEYVFVDYVRNRRIHNRRL